MVFTDFITGKIFDAYDFSAHTRNKDGTTFRTFAPAASRITVIGEFNDWQEWELNKTYDGNFWECYAKGAKPGMMYKYRIYRQDGNCVEHCDPYGFGMELRPNFASIIRDLSLTNSKTANGCRNVQYARTNHSISTNYISAHLRSLLKRQTTGTLM